MLYGNETWCLKEPDITIPRTTERAMVGSMCGIKLTERRKNDDLMEMLWLVKSVERLEKANGVRWYEHVLRRDELHPLRKALDFKMDGRRGRGRLKKMGKNQVEEGLRKVVLRKEDTPNRQIDMAGWCTSDCC